MRPLPILLLLLLSAPALSQPVLIITDARKPNPVAPYAYYLKNVNPAWTYEQVSRFPADSFTPINRSQVVQLAHQNGASWLRFNLSNRTNDHLFLISSFRAYGQFNVFVRDETNGQTQIQSGGRVPDSTQVVAVNPPVIPIGYRPQTIYIQVRRNGDAFGDYLRVGDMSQTLLAKKQTTRWQSIALGIFLLTFVYALVFFLRLRDSLLGWYALLMFSIILFYIDYYYLLDEYEPYLFWRKIPFFSSVYVYELCWSLFHIRFLNLRQYSRFLYWTVLLTNALIWADAFTNRISLDLSGSPFSFIDVLFNWLGLSWGSRILIVLYLLLISLIYVSFKDSRKLFLYAIAFLSSVITMIVAMFAWNNFEWLPFIPYNNIWVLGIVIEVIILGYILGDRANEHRRQQNRTQQQLIDQLQENLNQKNKLLQIRDEIARDLHDEVGATLTSIAISTKLVQKKVGTERPDITPILEQIQTDSQETIHTIRETVWALNSDNDDPEKLFERMQTTGFQMLANQDVDFTFENTLAPRDLLPFSMEQRRNLYFVFKESLHNIVKHAQATRVGVRIFRQATSVQIRIADNGTGFEPTQHGEGNGLKNFQKRAAEGGFAVVVCSELGRGTTVELCISICHPSPTAP